jgi:death on curing protein
MILYFPLELAIKQHDKIIEISGGLEGVKDRGQLESTLEFIRNDDYYPEFIDKLTHLVYAVTMNHCFHDGNKRSAITLGAYFLEINGLSHLVEVFILEMENIVLWVANHFINKEQLYEFIVAIVEQGGFNEEDKLKIATILTHVEAEHPEIIKPIHIDLSQLKIN